jgi:hypothetical protein
MRRKVSGFLILLGVAMAALVSPAAAQDLLTITGKVGATNRPAYDPFRDAFFKHHEVQFNTAYALDRTALSALPQKEVRAHVEGWPRIIAAKGPLLRDVLAAAKVADGARLMVMALDGYAAELEPNDLTAHEWIVAIEADGRPLGVGGRGPAWLMYDTGGKTIPGDSEAKWVWSAFLITAE